jgi:polygalacturonase
MRDDYFKVELSQVPPRESLSLLKYNVVGIDECYIDVWQDLIDYESGFELNRGHGDEKNHSLSHHYGILSFGITTAKSIVEILSTFIEMYEKNNDPNGEPEPI